MTAYNIAEARERNEKLLTLLEGKTLEILALRNSHPASVHDVPGSQRSLLLFALNFLADGLTVHMGRKIGMDDSESENHGELFEAMFEGIDTFRGGKADVLKAIGDIRDDHNLMLKRLTPFQERLFRVYHSQPSCIEDVPEGDRDLLIACLNVTIRDLCIANGSEYLESQGEG
uniref:Uncharacterized protein n=2 Tax=Rubinisphaera brasiliensis TaxID=119 RepID=F0SL28_RUBBR|nr:hypothetical protein Plabr_3314 [Rubinisphaera brasiliensis DSM 5305]